MSHVTPFPNALAPAATPEGLIDAVVHLVSTGAVPLGAYTLAELTVVDAVGPSTHSTGMSASGVLLTENSVSK